jgi:nitric oxide reductase subunit B
MATTQQPGKELSPWWKIGVIFTIFVGFSILIFIAVRAYKDAPPIPLKVVMPGVKPSSPGEISWPASRSS